jgi:hypothetical protein
MRLPQLTAIVFAALILPSCNRERECVYPIDPVAPASPWEYDSSAFLHRPSWIADDADAIRAECKDAANGDWSKWQHQTAAYRAALKAKVLALENGTGVGAGGLPLQRTPARYSALEGLNKFPLFEINPADSLSHLYDPESLATFRNQRGVIAAKRWLRRRDIDLIFVPLPAMAEVYVESFVQPCPADGIVAPHVRQTLLELLAADVETVDAFRLFRTQRGPGPELSYLFNAADRLWAPRAMRIVAREVAGRIERWHFQTRGPKPRFQTAQRTYHIHPDKPLAHWEVLAEQEGWEVLSDEQKARATRAQMSAREDVTLEGGIKPADDPRSPVLLIGDSHIFNFREQLIRALNMPVNTHWTESHTTESFHDFVNKPALLVDVRVVVWITTEQNMTHFEPMDASILAELDSDK